jgi:hypothetical protein
MSTFPFLDPLQPGLLFDEKSLAEPAQDEQEPDYASHPDGLYVRPHGLDEEEVLTIRRWSERQRRWFWVTLPMVALGFWYAWMISQDFRSFWPFAPFAVLVYALLHLRNGGSAYRRLAVGQKAHVMIGTLSPGKDTSDPYYIGPIPVEFASTELRNRAERPARVVADVFMGAEVLVFELRSLPVASPEKEGQKLAEGEIDCPGCGRRFVIDPSHAECPDCGLVFRAPYDP